MILASAVSSSLIGTCSWRDLSSCSRRAMRDCDCACLDWLVDERIESATCENTKSQRPKERPCGAGRRNSDRHSLWTRARVCVCVCVCVCGWVGGGLWKGERWHEKRRATREARERKTERRGAHLRCPLTVFTFLHFELERLNECLLPPAAIASRLHRLDLLHLGLGGLLSCCHFALGSKEKETRPNGGGVVWWTRR
jgi:hypothetical protein